MPLVESAGYTVVAQDEDDADIYIAMEGQGSDSEKVRDDKPVIRLCRDPAGASGENAAIYRYDRGALMHALAANMQRGKSA